MTTLHSPPFPTLDTERLTLRALLESDAQALYELRSDPGVMQYIGRPLFTGPDEALSRIRQINESSRDGDTYFWAISRKGDPQLIGTICFWNMVKEHFRTEIGYMLHAGHHGQGLMQEALSAVLDFGFRHVGLHSVEAQVAPANTASIRLLERNGFVREGLFRENYFFEGKFLDTAVYSLLAPLSVSA